MKGVEKELAAFKTAKALEAASTLLAQQKQVGPISVIAAEIESGLTPDDLRVIATDLRNRMTDGVVVLISRSSDRTSLVVAASDAAQKLGAKAGSLVKAGSAILGGGGGGRDDFAQGGGSDAGQIPATIAELTKTIASLVG
jgi:alanyl-tRNA synthetase